MKKLFHNAKIWSKSFDNNPSRFFEFFGIDDISGKILNLGYEKEILSIRDNYHELIDLKGKLVLPSFIDGHCHLVAGALVSSQINFRYVSSPKDILSEFSRYKKINKDYWIIGGYFSEANLKNNFKIDRTFLDTLCTSNPMFILRNDLHSCVLNSKAIEVLEIEKKKNDFLLNEVLTDADGKLTGEFYENAFTFIRTLIPKKTYKEKSEILKNEILKLHSLGITSVSDITFTEDLDVYKHLLENNSFNLRIDSRLPYEVFNEKEHFINDFTAYNEKINFKSFKAFYDGSLSSESAYFKKNYKGKIHNGMRTGMVNSGEFFELTKQIVSQGFQPSVHAIGDKSVQELLDFIHELNDSLHVINRFRIEHAQHIDKADFNLFKVKDIILSVQPSHLFFDAKIAQDKLDNPESTHCYKPLTDDGIITCFGSDFPVVEINPLNTIYYAMTRAVGKFNEKFYPQYCYDLETCLRAYTINNAYACFEENERGSIEDGKYADFIVLNNDIFLASPDEIIDTKVEMTYINGQRVY